jgi:ligand-binding sensor domain-containing protein
MAKFRGIVFCIVLAVFSNANAQQAINASFHHLFAEQGLSNTNAYAMLKDSRGFMWLGTLNGLTRFDGLQCKVYKPSNSGIMGVAIKSIVEDKIGNLWVGTEAGLNYYDRQKDVFTFIKIQNITKDYTAWPFAIDNNGLLWVDILDTKITGTYTFDYKSKRFVLRSRHASSNFYLDNNQFFKSIKSHYLEGPNDIGFKKINFENYKEIQTEVFFDGKNGLPALAHLAEYLYVDNDSLIWITGNTKGLIKFNPKKRTFKVFTNTIKLLTRIIPYKNFLIMGSNEGVFVFDKSTEKFVQNIKYSNSNQYGPSSNWSEIFYIDAEDNLFLSNIGRGVDYTNLNRPISESWLDSETSAILGYNDNMMQHIFLGQNEVFAKYHNGPLMVLDFNGKFKRKYDHHEIFLSDSQRRQWIFNGKNLECYDPKSAKLLKYYFKEFDGSLGWEMQMEEISKTSFLISSRKGVFEFDEKANKLSPLTDFNKEVKFRIKPLYYDKNTEQVFLMSDWFINFYALQKKNNKWEIVKEIKNLNVYGIRPAVAAGYVWLCSRKGLLKMNTKTFEIKTITEKDGLPDNFVTDIIEEQNGNYYIVTGKGIAYYDKKENKYRSFTSKDGIYSSDINWNCAFKLPDGRVVFGGTNGISVIEKDALKSYAIKPKIQITDLFINEKPLVLNQYIGENKQLKLGANQNSFTLKIVGIEYGFPEKVKIQYKLEGSDSQWITVSNPATVRYTNVSEGNYIFKVKASDEDGKVSSETKTIAITVYAPYYRTNWFRSLLLIGFVLLGYMLYRLRTTQIRKDARKKEEIKRIKAESEINSLRSQMNPHFIFNCLNTVDSYILRNKTDEASEFLNKFSRLIRMILENSREDYVPLSQDLEALELYIFLEQERSHPKFNYSIKTASELQSDEYYIPATLIQPFVENAILHGLRNLKDSTGQLNIEVSIKNNLLFVSITDNGIGREASEKLNEGQNLQKKSLGLKLTLERILKVNELYPNQAAVDIIDIDENRTTGTCIEMTLPLITETTMIP